jgi:deoxyinosine 3'endonuclease (endonuclease V)
MSHLIDAPAFKRQLTQLKKTHNLRNNPGLLDRLTNATPTCPFLVGGIDLSFIPNTGDKSAICGYTIMAYRGPELDLIQVYNVEISVQLEVPYVAGYLGFRESKPMVDTVNHQKTTRPDVTPDVILVDGNGYLHPHRFGSACHLGVNLDIPTIGVGKKMHYFGQNRANEVREDYERAFKNMSRVGQELDIYEGKYERQSIGVAICTKIGQMPIFVSQGHQIGLDEAIEVVLATISFKKPRILPEPIFRADFLSRKAVGQLSDKLYFRWRSSVQHENELTQMEKDFWLKKMSKPKKSINNRRKNGFLPKK